MTTTVIHIHDAPANWWEDPQFVYIGRAIPRLKLPGSKWANPYKVQAHGRAQAIIHYAVWLHLDSGLVPQVGELRDKTLVCWCKQDPCHGDVLAALADQPDGYPWAWTHGYIQREVYTRAGWRCEHCGMEFPEGDTRARYARNDDGKPTILTVHHLSGDPADCSYNNLLACCQKCHLSIQATWKPGKALPWPEPPEWLTRRNLSYQPNNQPVLLTVDQTPLNERDLDNARTNAVRLFKAWQTANTQETSRRFWTYLSNLLARDRRLWEAAQQAVNNFTNARK